MKTVDILREGPLFKGVGEGETENILSSVPHFERDFRSGDVILAQGDVTQNIGIVLRGRAKGVKYTYEGDETVASIMEKGRIFADVLSGRNGFASPVTVTAVTDCKVLFINYPGLFGSDNPMTLKVLQNMIQNISLKYFFRSRRTDMLAQRTLRGKILAFLEWQAEEKGSDSFTVDFDRRRMADFLCVDRASLSRELSRMKKEGIIDYKKKEFYLMPG